MAKKKKSRKGGNYLLHSFIVLLLTLVSQVGGLIWLLALLCASRAKKKRAVQRIAWFVGLYALSCSLVVPFLASQGGRVPLPVFEGQLRPASLVYPLLNRHYINQASKHALHDALLPYFAAKTKLEVHYLDAGFPFLSGFPLLPHLSHKDGRKLDLSFHYQKEGKPANQSPSYSGYGVFEGPNSGEQNMIEQCRQQGYWQYSYAEYLSFGERAGIAFDERQTRRLVQALTEHSRVRKIFLEPHLKKRLGFSANNKVRYHGCQAVRHDDHLHVEFR